MTNSNVLIIGSNGGMGQAITKKFLDNKDYVYGLDIHKNSNGKNVNYFQIDIRDEQSIYNAFNQIKEKINKIDSIVCASGVYLMDSLLEVSEDDLKRVLDINVLGVYRVVKTFFPLLTKDSRILIITSELSTLDPLPFNGIYSISKALLEKYAYSLRMELNIFGIKVITIRPGAVETNLLNASTKSMDEFCRKTQIHKTSSKRFKKIIDSVETKAISSQKLAKLVFKISKIKRPRYSYSINRNIGLLFLSALPKRLQVWIISKLIK